MTTTTKTQSKPSLVKISKAVKSIVSTNEKLQKTPYGETIINVGISLAPSARSKVGNVCQYATAGCILACVLWFGGRTVTSVVRLAAINRTILFLMWPLVFYARLHLELIALIKQGKKLGSRIFFRPNIASDIRHESELCHAYPIITFYDYTKDYQKAIEYGFGMLPTNYHASFSVSESTSWQQAFNLNQLGVNLVVPFDSYYIGNLHRYGVLPESVTFRGPQGQQFTCKVVDGDIHDIRTPEFDGIGNCVALRAKGSKASRLKGLSKGFIRHFAGGSKWHVNEYVCNGSVVVNLL